MKPRQGGGSSSSSMDTDGSPPKTRRTDKDSTGKHYLKESNKAQQIKRRFISRTASGSNGSQQFFDPNETMRGDDQSDAQDASQSEAGTPNPGDTEEEASGDNTPGENLTDRMKHLKGAAHPVSQAVQNDLAKVKEAISLVGGLEAKKGDNNNRKRQILELENVDLDLGNFEPLPERPQEDTLPVLPLNALLPPPSSVPVPLDFKFDPLIPQHVKEKRIEFLLLKKYTATPSKKWSFPGDVEMRKVFDDVRNKIDQDMIMDVCLHCRIDRDNGIASLTLSTIDLHRVRHEIRIYNEIEGVKFETYSKATFVQRYGISMYVPKEHAGLSATKILRTLFYKNPTIKIRLLSKHRFETDHPNRAPNTRSRIGDAIYVFESNELALKLKPYDEEHRFTVSKGFNVTLKGGARGETEDIFSDELKSNVVSAAASKEVAKQMRR